jgi:protein-L-isoaspartate O-methyltransferase
VNRQDPSRVGDPRLRRVPETSGPQAVAPADDPERLQAFRERYGRRQTDTARRIERQVLGHDAGQNGYTTLDQARRLVSLLELGPGSRALDLGTGRGWPGVFLAAVSGCAVTVTDIPVAALRHARREAAALAVSERVEAVSAAGARLPFAPGSFDGVVHADVLC